MASIAALPLGLRVPFQRWHRPAMAAPFNRPDQASRTRGARMTDALPFDRSPNDGKPERGSADCVQAFKES
jgi:hypothetical protein